MKTIGLIGGLSWRSTMPYYQVINETVSAHLGDLHSAKLVLYNLDFHELQLLQQANAWNEIGHRLCDAAGALGASGAQLILLCSSSMHKVFDLVQREVEVPLLHITDSLAATITRAGLKRVGLLGTRFTMEQDFYHDRLRDRYGLDVLVPAEEDRFRLHKLIYNELCQGRAHADLRRYCNEVIRQLTARGAQGVILGCTELSALMETEIHTIPIFNTASIHARHAALLALGTGKDAHEADALRQAGAGSAIYAFQALNRSSDDRGYHRV